MGVVVFTKVRGLAKSESPQTLRVLGLQTLLVLGPLQKLETDNENLRHAKMLK